METFTEKFQEFFLCNKHNSNITLVGDIILAAAVESSIDENWCLLKNQSTFNTFINVKYLSNIIDSLDGKYICVHCNTGLTHTNKVGDLTGYSDPFWYNPNEISNIPSLGLVQENHLMTYNIQDGNNVVFHSPHQPKFKITKYDQFYHDMRHLLKSKYAHIMVNKSCSPIPQVKENNKGYTARNIKRADCKRRFQHITGQSINKILH